MPILRALRAKQPLVLICVLAIAAGASIARAEEPAPSIQPITAPEVEQAVAKVKADPNLAHERKVRTLRWSSNDNAPKKKHGWLKWIGEFFGFLAETSRVIVWLVIAIAIALLVVAIVRIFRSVEPRSRATPFTAPTHVREMDIRPESLPEDIGAAALALWEHGEHRAALALLYRGLLSRLVHSHEMPIRHSSTEGDCMALAVERLVGDRGEYVTRVIRVWQRAVYGAQLPQAADVHFLCTGFAAALNKATLDKHTMGPAS